MACAYLGYVGDTDVTVVAAIAAAVVSFYLFSWLLRSDFRKDVVKPKEKEVNDDLG